MSEHKNAAPMNTEEHGLKKTNLKVSTVVFMIFCFVAAGCYGIEEMIPSAGPGMTIILLIVLPFVWGVPFGLVASELGSVRPQEGGYYKWVQEALGEFWGFQAGLWRTISVYIDNTSYVILAGGYAATALDLSRPQEFTIKIVMIAIFTFINIRGIKDVGSVSTVLSVLIIVAFAMVAVCGFMHWGQGTDISFRITPEPAHSAADWFFYIAGGLSVGMWMYSGYESMSTMAGEVENPQVIPKGTMLSIPLIMIVYIFPTVAGLGSLGQWDKWAFTGVGTVGYADVVETFWGAGFSLFFLVIAILAECSIYNTYIASGSRGFFALADDNLAPPILVKCDKKRGVPYVSVLSVGIANLLMCMLPFGVIIVIDMFLLVSSYILVFISALILRKRIPREEYKFRIPGGYGTLCVICTVPICVGVFSYFVNGSDYLIGGMLGILAGPVMYFIWRHLYGGLTKKDPVRYPMNIKTGLAVGDMKRLTLMLGLLTVIGLVGLIFLPFYEDGWTAADYYDGMFENKFGASDAAQLAGGQFIFSITYTLIKVVTAITGILTVICGIAAIKMEPRTAKKQWEA